ncbi:MAG: vWA domain-containing protein, partial [Thermodesulfobacteriota bacterium]
MPKSGLTSNWIELLNSVKGLKGKYEDYTDMESAFLEASRILSAAGLGRRKIIILITDGFPCPDPAISKKRYPELASASRIVACYQGDRDRSSAGYYSKQRIMNTILPALKQNNIQVFAIAPGASAMTKFLEDLTFIANGDRESFRVIMNNQQLVSDAQSIIPMQENTIVIADKEIAQDMESFSLAVGLRTWIRRIRATVIPTSEFKGDIVISFSGTGGTRAISSSTNSDARLSAVDSQNNHVFDRIVFSPGGVDGEGHFNVSFKSKFGGSPAARFIVEAVTSLHLEIGFNPESPKEGLPLKISVALMDNQQNAYPLSGAMGRIVGPDGITDMINLSVNEKGIASARYDPAPGKSGEYHLEVTGQILGFENAYIKGRAKFKVGVAEPVFLKVSIPTGKGDTSKKSTSFCFKQLDLSTPAVEIKNIKIQTDSPRRTKIKILVEPLLPSTPDSEPLEPEKWIKILPSDQFTLSDKIPVTFTLRAEIPKLFPQSVKNGFYNGRLIIESPDIEGVPDFPTEFDIELPINIPEIGVLESIPVTNPWRIPGRKTISIPIKTDAVNGLQVEIDAVSQFEAIREDGSTEPIEESLLKLVAKDKSTIAKRDKNGRLKMQLVYGSIPPGKYRMELTLKSPSAREKTISIFFIIPPHPRSYYVRLCAFSFLFVFLLGFVFANTHWSRIRPLTARTRGSVSLPEGVDPGSSNPINRLLRIERTTDKRTRKVKYVIAGSGRDTMRFTPTFEDGSFIDPSREIQPGSTVKIGDYLIDILDMDEMDTEGNSHLTYFIRNSPHQRHFQLLSNLFMILGIGA